MNEWRRIRVETSVGVWERDRQGDAGRGHRSAECCNIDLNFLTTLIQYSVLHLSVLLLLVRGTPGGLLAPPAPFEHLLAALRDSCLTVTDRDSGGTYEYIISQRPHVPVVNSRVPLPAVSLRERITSAHRLFSGNHFVFTDRASCPRNPPLTALSKVNMQHYFSVNSSNHPLWLHCFLGILFKQKR